MKSLEIGIVSDSHGRLAALETMAARNPAVAVWFHCGDYCEDAEALALCTAAPVYTVLGNNDYYRSAGRIMGGCRRYMCLYDTRTPMARTAAPG